MNKVSETPSKTQGHYKMLLYIEDLIRNKHFRRLIKRYKQASKKDIFPSGKYDDYTVEQKNKADYFNREANQIINGYESLRKRCKKLFRDKAFIVKESIATKYGLDNDLIHYAVSKIGKKNPEQEFLGYMDDPDMCKIIDLYDDELNPANKGEEIIYLMPHRQLDLAAYPVAVVIHPRSSKRDVLDFIEKKWKWIDQMLSNSNEKRVLKIRKRKHSQLIVDFIWNLRSLSANKIKMKLDKEFPNNRLLYYEIGKILQLEKERRFKDLT